VGDPRGHLLAIALGHDAELDAFERKLAAGDWRAALAGVKPVTFGYAARQFGLTFP
jgi:hypothetical protein